MKKIERNPMAIIYLPQWKPRCYCEETCDGTHYKIDVTNETQCQNCGHEDCVCQFFSEPCNSCPYRDGVAERELLECD